MRANYRDIAHRAVGEYYAAQDQDELATVLMLADLHDVVRVVEIGTYFGGTSWAFSRLPSVEQIITIDIDKRWRHIGEKIQFVEGDSTDPETIDCVDRLLDGGLPDLLIIDGGHDSAQVRADWYAYGHTAEMVMFHDINEWGNHPEIQVRKEWLQIAAPFPHVEICANRTTAPGTGVLWRDKEN